MERDASRTGIPPPNTGCSFSAHPLFSSHSQPDESLTNNTPPCFPVCHPSNRANEETTFLRRPLAWLRPAFFARGFRPRRRLAKSSERGAAARLLVVAQRQRHQSVHHPRLDRKS